MTGKFYLHLHIADLVGIETEDPFDEPLGIWMDWSIDAAKAFRTANLGIDTAGIYSWDAVIWDGEMCKIMMSDPDTGLHGHWMPRNPPPAELMQYATRRPYGERAL